jgi:uncharacterized protein (TIGR02453 family)
MLKLSTLQFLKDLKRNNDKSWFDANRKNFEAAKDDFESFIQSVIQEFGKRDEEISLLVAKQCTFKQNRDVRFSKDKSPYKINMGAYMARSGGRKSPFAGYYFHLEPHGSIVGGGIWMPMPDKVKKIRQEIDYSFDDFKKIVSSKKFKSTYKDLSREKEFALTNVPKGYEKDNPAAEYLKLKSWVTTTPVTDEELTSKGLLKKAVTSFEALMPLVKFLNRALED